MKLNCKTGDLVVVVFCPESKWIGRVFVLGQLEMADAAPFVGQSGWATTPRTYDDDGLEVLFRDCWLKPLRDPGEDAKDETLSWLPVPSKEKAPA